MRRDNLRKTDFITSIGASQKMSQQNIGLEGMF